MNERRKIPEGYQPKEPKNYTGPGKPPTGGSGVRPAPPDETAERRSAMTDDERIKALARDAGVRVAQHGMHHIDGRRILEIDKTTTIIADAIRTALDEARRDEKFITNVADKVIFKFKDQLSVAREALEFYADPANYDDEGAPGNVVWASGVVEEWEEDRGTIAREALAKIDREKHD